MSSYPSKSHDLFVTPQAAAADPAGALPQRPGLLNHPALWRAGQLESGTAAYGTGFARLDEQLPGGGWPQAGPGELLLHTSGQGELRLLAPLLRRLSLEQERWLIWIDPPFVPYAPALQALGVDLSRILVVRPKTPEDALWALERAARAGSCSLALAWIDEAQLSIANTRRLQLAAKQGHTFTCLFRPRSAEHHKSMAELRLGVSAAGPGAVSVDVCKRRGGWPVSGIRVQISRARQIEAVREQLRLWRQLRQSRRAGTSPPVGARPELHSVEQLGSGPFITH